MFPELAGCHFAKLGNVLKTHQFWEVSCVIYAFIHCHIKLKTKFCNNSACLKTAWMWGYQQTQQKCCQFVVACIQSWKISGSSVFHWPAEGRPSNAGLLANTRAELVTMLSVKAGVIFEAKKLLWIPQQIQIQMPEHSTVLSL